MSKTTSLLEEKVAGSYLFGTYHWSEHCRIVYAEKALSTYRNRKLSISQSAAKQKINFLRIMVCSKWSNKYKNYA